MAETLRFPGGFADPHVHYREPGATQKEDFESGTKAQLAGGIIDALDMPNNPGEYATLTPERLKEKEELAEGRVWANLGFHYGSEGNNIKTFPDPAVQKAAFALKEYMNVTTGNLVVTEKPILDVTFRLWPKVIPLVVHAENQTLETAIDLMKTSGRKLHVAHISLEEELKMVTQTKEEGYDITCEVTPHHLFLNENNVGFLKGKGKMKPPLATEKDRLYLLDHLDEIDVLATDHAPHTLAEKDSFTEENGPYGVPGIETSLVLAFKLIDEGYLSEKHLVEMMDTNPRKIFGIPKDESSEVVIERGVPHMIEASELHSKAGWTPFECFVVSTSVKEVILSGELAYKNGEFIGKPKGRVIKPIRE